MSYLDRKELTSIRPLIYVPEREVVSFVRNQNITVVKSPCPVDGYTKREEIKEFVYAQRKLYAGFDAKVFGAIKRSEMKGWMIDV